MIQFILILINAIQRKSLYISNSKLYTMRIQFIILFFFIADYASGQTISGKELLDKAIAYHDPNNNWQSFRDTLNVTMQMPNKPDRISKIIINLPEELFYVKATNDTITTEYILNKKECSFTFNGQKEISEAAIKENKLSCERANLYKNYYTYLYGLPMKLKDEGTIIDEKIERKTFKGIEYLVLKVTYDQAVGNDIWYFYFNPETYAMEIYQFFKTDEKGKIKKDSGEYILLTEEATISNIKMPKNRAWFYNKDDGYLGTDSLKQ